MQTLQWLVTRGKLKADDLARATQDHAAAGNSRPLHEFLIERGFAREEDVLAALADEFGMELVDLTQIKVEPEALQAVPLKLVHRHTLMPLARANGALTVATGD